MSNGIYIDGPIAFMEGSGSAVFFSASDSSAGEFSVSKNTAPVIKKVQTALDVAYWGEDNRFPQNIEQQMAYCGMGKAALEWKAKVLYGNGIVPGKIIESSDDGSVEVFKPLQRSGNAALYKFIENRSMFRFWLEYFQDWTWFTNNFPEVVLTKDCSEISHFVHQESCDSRYKQMNEQGVIDTVYLSKLWGKSSDQYAKFDPNKKLLGILENPTNITEVDSKYMKALDCLDMYDSINSLKILADKLKDGQGLKSCILPVNFPSVNKTYYQVATWDGARLGGWVEIASKIPAIIKAMLNKAARLKYHIEIPESYFEVKFGREIWFAKKETEKSKAREDLLKEMDEYLTGVKNAYSTFLSFFQVASHSGQFAEYGRVKITPIEDKSNIDKELITTSAANIEILTAMGVHPTLIGSGTIGTGTQRTGGSDQREAYLIYTSLLNLERQVALEPLYLARDYNQWGDDIVFRIRDTQLTTLDQHSGTKEVLS